MGFIGMDVHRDACQVCVLEPAGGERQERIPSRVDDLRRFAAGLGREDIVAIEATGPAAAVARIIEEHAGQVVVVNPRRLGQIAARAKTDQIDARTLARLLAAGVLTGVWTPDEPPRTRPSDDDLHGGAATTRRKRSHEWGLAAVDQPSRTSLGSAIHCPAITGVSGIWRDTRSRRLGRDPAGTRIA